MEQFYFEKPASISKKDWIEFCKCLTEFEFFFDNACRMPADAPHCFGSLEPGHAGHAVYLSVKF